MSAKVIDKGSNCRSELIKGVQTIVQTVGVTLGPKGRNVIIDKSFGAPKSTKDGVTVAKEIELENRMQNMGASMVKEAASKSDDKAGDGTTTTVVLAGAIATEGAKAVAAGMNPMDLKRGMDKAVTKVLDFVQRKSKNISSTDEVAQVATVSANGDKSIGKVIAESFDKVGKDGVIAVEEANKSDLFSAEVVQGMNFDRGYLSPYFITNSEKMTCELEDCKILLFDKKITSIQPMLPLLESIMQSGKPFLMIAEDIEGDALATLIINKLRGGMKIAAVKSPGFGDRRKSMLEDIAILTGAQLISEELGLKLENVKIDDLGKAEKITITKDDTTIVRGCGSKHEINSRCEQLKSQIEETSSDYDKEKLQERLGKLSGGVAVLKVGGVTEVEVKERKDRVEDAYNATKAAIEQGIVPGGGCTLLYASKVLDQLKGDNDDEDRGISIVKNALKAPTKTILENAGLEQELIVAELLNANKQSMIYDAQKIKVVDAFESGIIDPTKVVRNSLMSAVSVASILVTTEAAIYEKPKNNFDNSTPASGAGMGGGMGSGGMPGMM
jgi:chaperonin GroEL